MILCMLNEVLFDPTGDEFQVALILLKLLTFLYFSIISFVAEFWNLKSIDNLIPPLPPYPPPKKKCKNHHSEAYQMGLECVVKSFERLYEFTSTGILYICLKLINGQWTTRGRDSTYAVLAITSQIIQSYEAINFFNRLRLHTCGFRFETTVTKQRF